MTDLVINKGKTFTRTLRWEAPPVVYKPITAITQTAPVAVTCVGHGVPSGWRVAVVSVKGMTQINSESTPPKAKDYLDATVTDENTVVFNTINAADYKAYVSGGYLQYNTPVNLVGHAARMSIKDKIGGTELFRLDTTNGRIVVDDATKTIAITMSAADTAAMTFKKGVYDLEVESAGGVVTLLLSGDVSIVGEVTTV